jgi:hypothetical protein
MYLLSIVLAKHLMTTTQLLMEAYASIATDTFTFYLSVFISLAQLVTERAWQLRGTMYVIYLMVQMIVIRRRNPAPFVILDVL